MALCKSSVLKIYQAVMDDVISNSRDVFQEEGVDEQVLIELQNLWESKLIATKTVDVNASTETPESTTKQASTKKTDNIPQVCKREPFVQTGKNQYMKASDFQSQPAQPVPQPTPYLENNLIPIQITIPTEPTLNSPTRALTIQVPVSALNGPQLHALLTGPVITATMGLPPAEATYFLQQHVNTALENQQKQQMAMNKHNMSQVDGVPGFSENILCLPGTSGLNDFKNEQKIKIESTEVVDKTGKNKRLKKGNKPFRTVIHMGDGGNDSSDDDDISEDDGSDDEIDEKEDDADPEKVPEDEPLNSEDDVSDDGPQEEFDTENVVVCQFDKITRSRNKWKFYLKDGIMNLNSVDYVFQKANGDAEW